MARDDLHLLQCVTSFGQPATREMGYADRDVFLHAADHLRRRAEQVVLPDPLSELIAVARYLACLRERLIKGVPDQPAVVQSSRDEVGVSSRSEGEFAELS